MDRRRRAALGWCATMLWAAPAAAQSTTVPVAAAGAAPAPCTADTNARRFDFWVGEWEVRTARGQPAGRSSVQRVSGGCGLLEHWTDRRGGTGRSLNAYNRAAAAWQQFWVGQAGEVTEYRESAWLGASLVFLARTALPDGAPVVRRMTFTPLAGDSVRQLGEDSRDGGTTWATTFDLVYHRQGGRPRTP